MDSLQLYDLMSQQHAAEVVPAGARVFAAFPADRRQRSAPERPGRRRRQARLKETDLREFPWKFLLFEKLKCA
jgi:hypothetical protein